MKRRYAFASILLLLLIACPGPEPEQFVPPDLIAPASESTITQNPPTFVWHSVEDTGIVYLFEIASDYLFISLVYQSPSISPPDTSYTLESALSPGIYYWHACVKKNC